MPRIIFVDIGREKLAVIWLNGVLKEDSDINVCVLGLCRVEDSNKPMGILCL